MFVGLVGKPSSGKSTFFRAATLAAAEIANYPFTTIEPNTAVGYVVVECVDKEFQTNCNPRTGFCIDHNRFVPVKITDVAGLIPGAHKGLGQGNQFLDDLRQADALIHVVDASGSTDEQGRAVNQGTHDPIKDAKFLETELDLWFLSILKKSWERFAKQTYMEHHKVSKAIATQFSGLNTTPEIVKKIIHALELDEENPLKWSEQQLSEFAASLRKITKPIIIAANKADLPSSKYNLKNLHDNFPKYIIIPCSAEAELALREASRDKLISYIPGSCAFVINKLGSLSEKQKIALAFIEENVLKPFNTTGIQECLNKAVFDLLNYIAVFPGGVNKLHDQHGNILPDCILMPKNSTALDFAFKLHTDLGTGFVRAIDARSKKTIGKDYILKHRDIIEIISTK